MGDFSNFLEGLENASGQGMCGLALLPLPRPPPPPPLAPAESSLSGPRALHFFTACLDLILSKAILNSIITLFLDTLIALAF